MYFSYLQSLQFLGQNFQKWLLWPSSKNQGREGLAPNHPAGFVHKMGLELTNLPVSCPVPSNHDTKLIFIFPLKSGMG